MNFREYSFPFTLLFAIVPLHVYADNVDNVTDADTVMHYNIRDVFITVPSLSVSYFGYERAVSDKQIGRLPVQSVNDVLKYSAGVDVRQRGPMGAQTDIGVRGSSFEQVGILLDGINISDPQTGHNSFDLPFDKSDIDYIAVAGSAFSSSLMMSAVNVVTKTEENNSATAHLEGGSYGYLSAGARVTTGGEKTGRNWNNMLSVNFGRSDGYSRSKAGRLNSDMEYKKAFYKGRFNSYPFNLGWHAGVSYKDWGSNTFYSSRFDDQFEHTLKTYTAIQAETHGFINFQPRIWWNHTEDRFELIRGDESSVPFNYHRNDVTGAGFRSWVNWGLGITSLGAEIKNDNLVSGNLGEPLDAPKHIKGTGRDYTNGLKRTSYSVSIEHDFFRTKDFNLHAGIVGVRNTWNGTEMRFYPGLDITTHIINPLEIHASYTTSMRLPSVTELYYSVGGYKADKHLKPEELKSLNMEIAYYDFYDIGVTVKTLVYYNIYSNLIDWIMRLDLPESERQWESVNFTDVKSFGTELSAILDFERILPGQHVLKSFDLTYNYITQQKIDVPNIQSRSTLEYLKHKAAAGIQIGVMHDMDLTVNVRYQDREGTFTDFDGQVRPYDPYCLVDARLQYCFGPYYKDYNGKNYKYHVFLEGNNLTDISYYDYGCVPQPGLWVNAGISVDLRNYRRLSSRVSTVR